VVRVSLVRADLIQGQAVEDHVGFGRHHRSRIQVVGHHLLHARNLEEKERGACEKERRRFDL
jgi:hypothetical protein